jgi:hypothetical protein
MIQKVESRYGIWHPYSTRLIENLLFTFVTSWTQFIIAKVSLLGKLEINIIQSDG